MTEGIGGSSDFLSSVEITDDALLICASHALTTEKEEVMGLLLGDIEVIIVYIIRIVFILF